MRCALAHLQAQAVHKLTHQARLTLHSASADSPTAAALDTLLARRGRRRYELGPLVTSVVCEYEILAFTPTGWFDDRESGGILIAKPEYLRRLYPEIDSVEVSTSKRDTL
ncbi:hypothetical protein GCM10027277_52320 [Pseudoduganella ginsengisoli]